MNRKILSELLLYIRNGLIAAAISAFLIGIVIVLIIKHTSDTTPVVIPNQP